MPISERKAFKITDAKGSLVYVDAKKWAAGKVDTFEEYCEFYLSEKPEMVFSVLLKILGGLESIAKNSPINDQDDIKIPFQEKMPNADTLRRFFEDWRKDSSKISFPHFDYEYPKATRRSSFFAAAPRLRFQRCVPSPVLNLA